MSEIESKSPPASTVSNPDGRVKRKPGRPVKDPLHGPQRPIRIPLGYPKDSPEGRAELSRRIRAGQKSARLKRSRMGEDTKKLQKQT